MVVSKHVSFRLAGTLPFESASNAEEVDNVVHARYSYDDENWEDISFEGMNVIFCRSDK